MEGAARIIVLQADNEDALLVLTDGSMQKQQHEAVMRYAAQLINALGSKTKPTQYDEPAWQKKKATLLGRAHFKWRASAGARDLVQDGEAHLRAAQPLSGVDPAVTAPTRFYLGWSNYQLERTSGRREQLDEALKFTRQAAAIAGPVQAQARQNVAAIEQELARK